MITAQTAADIRAREDALRAWLGSRCSYKTEEAIAAGLKPPTNEERSALEVFEFVRDKPERYFVYISLPPRVKSKTYPSSVAKYRDCYGGTGRATTWTGDPLGEVQFGRAWSDNFGGTRISISVYPITGEAYHGTYFASAGDYARIQKAKRKGKPVPCEVPALTSS